MNIEDIKQKITPILKQQGVLKAAIFGSVAQGNMTKNSDIDIVVQLNKNKSLLDLIGLKLDLEDKLGKNVDMVSYKGISKFLKNIILKDQKIIYESRKEF